MSVHCRRSHSSHHEVFYEWKKLIEPQRFKQILITQTTLDIITEDLVNSNNADAPKAIIAKVDDRYFSYEVTQADRDSR